MVGSAQLLFRSLFTYCLLSRPDLKRPRLDVQYIMQFQLHVLNPKCQAMEEEVVMTLDMLNQSPSGAKKIMNLKEMQPLAVTMESGQVKHPTAKVCTSRMQIVLLVVLEQYKQLFNTLCTLFEAKHNIVVNP